MTGCLPASNIAGKALSFSRRCHLQHPVPPSLGQHVGALGMPVLDGIEVVTLVSHALNIGTLEQFAHLIAQQGSEQQQKLGTSSPGSDTFVHVIPVPGHGRNRCVFRTVIGGYLPR